MSSHRYLSRPSSHQSHTTAPQPHRPAPVSTTTTPSSTVADPAAIIIALQHALVRHSRCQRNFVENGYFCEACVAGLCSSGTLKCPLYYVNVSLSRVIFTGYASSMARRKVSPSPHRSSRSPPLQRQYLHLHGRGRWQRMQAATSWMMRSRAVTSVMWILPCFVDEPETCYYYTSSELHHTPSRMLSEYLRSHPDDNVSIASRAIVTSAEGTHLLRYLQPMGI
jgi:hypothetical protein